ncbi:hypothetical protein B0H14DRAFT_2651323 [Mycena olivaceomarginata]|nr:hypothetical protein B0H14DRAFT_2651323 [Mycena olivaceomarginata]
MCTQTEEDTPTPPWIKNIRRVYLRLPQNPGDPDIRVHHPGPAGSVAEALNNMFAKNGNVGCTSAFSAPPSPLHTPASVILPQGQGNNEGDVNMQADDDDMIDQLASDDELNPAHVHTLASASVPTPPLASFSEKPGSDLSDRLSAIEEQMGQMMGAVSYTNSNNAMVVDIRQTAEGVATRSHPTSTTTPVPAASASSHRNHPVLRGDNALETQQSTKYIKETVEGQQLLHIVPETHGQQPTQSIKVPTALGGGRASYRNKDRNLPPAQSDTLWPTP